MLRQAILFPFGLALLSGCGGGQGDYPRLLPTEAILAEPVLPEHAAPAAASAAPVKEAVKARGAATRAAAEAIPDPVDQDALSARAADLRRRAEGLRRADSAETMGAAENCPPGADPRQCPPPAE